MGVVVYRPFPQKADGDTLLDQSSISETALLAMSEIVDNVKILQDLLKKKVFTEIRLRQKSFGSKYLSPHWLSR
jgi:hypothetical protein